MPDSCDSSTTSEEGASLPEVVRATHPVHITTRDNRWDYSLHGYSQLLGRNKHKTAAHAQTQMMSGTCAQNQFVIRSHGLDARQDGLLTQPAAIASNQRWVSFNKEVLQNILENTIKKQMTQAEPEEGASHGSPPCPSVDIIREDTDCTSRHSQHDTDSSDCLVNVDGSTTTVDSDSDDESINVTRCDDDVTDLTRTTSDHDETSDDGSSEYTDKRCGRGEGKQRSGPSILGTTATGGGGGGGGGGGAHKPCVAGAPVDPTSAAGFQRLTEQSQQPTAYVRTCRDGSSHLAKTPVSGGELVVDGYRCWQSISGYSPRADVTGDTDRPTRAGGDRARQATTLYHTQGSTSELPLRYHNTASLADSGHSALELCSYNMTVEQHQPTKDSLSAANLDYHGNTIYNNTDKDGTRCSPCKTNVVVRDKEISTMMKCGETCVNNEKCFNGEQFDNNSKKKARPCIVMVPGRQHWVRISKSAIEDILDELVVSSISDDSGTESRSHTPTSDVSDVTSHKNKNDAVVRDSDVMMSRLVCDSAGANEHVERSTCSPDKSVTNVSHRPDRHTQTHAHANAHSNAQTNAQCLRNTRSVTHDSKTSEHRSSISTASLSQALADSKSQPTPLVINSGDTNEDSGTTTAHCDQTKQVNPAPGPVSNTPAISDTGLPGPETLKSDGDNTSSADDELGDSANISGLMSSGPWSNPATALLLGALCIGEHKKVCELADARANKRHNPALLSGGPCAKSSRDDSDCIGIDLRTSKRDEPAPVVPSEDCRGQMRASFIPQNRKLTASTTPPRKLAQAARRGRPGRIRSRGSRDSMTISEPQGVVIHEVIDVDSHEMSIVPRPAHLPGHHDNMSQSYSSTNLIPEQTNMCAINLATNTAHHVNTEPHILKDPSNSNYVTMDGSLDGDYRSQPTDLSAHPDKIGFPKAMKGDKSAQNKTGRKNTKITAKSKKEPRYGWIVVSKDEVHTIMDSLTSQLFMDEMMEGSENNTKELTAQDTRCNVKQTNTDILRNKENEMNKHHSPNDVKLTPTSADKCSEERGAGGRDDVTSRKPHPDDAHEDEEFRRTTIDALNAVYEHEDGIDTGINSFNRTTQGSGTHRDLVTPVSVSDQPSSPEHDDDSDSTSTSNDGATLDLSRDASDGARSGDVSNTELHADGDVMHEQSGVTGEGCQDRSPRGFKWKSSILARVLDDQDTDSCMYTTSSSHTDVSMVKPKKRPANPTTTRRIKKPNKRR